MPELFLFTSGPKGRGVNVDVDGRLVLNSDPGASPFVFTYGETGRPISVDPSGRLLVNLALIANEYNTLQSASGISPDFDNYNNFFLDLEHDATINMPLPGKNAKYLIVIRQAVGSKSVTFTNTIWAEGTAATLTAASGSVDAVFLAYVPQLSSYMADFRNNWS